MRFWRNRSHKEPVPGSMHVRRISGRALEQAEVVDVTRDSMGIPHVRYRVTHVQSSRSAKSGFRVLALASFMEQFRQIDQAA